MKKKNKINEVVMIIIEYMWLAMAVFTAIAGVMKFNEDGGFAVIFAWVFIVLSIMCVIMFFVRRSARKRRRGKNN